MMDTSKLSPVQTRGGVQSSTISSKALKVLLAVILAIGLMPAVSTQKAFAASTATLKIDGATINDGDKAPDDAWEFANDVLTVRGAIKGAVEVTGDITIKSVNDAASITAADVTAVTVTGDLTIDTTKGALAVSTVADKTTAAKNAVVATGTVDTVAGTTIAPAKAFTANTALVSETVNAAIDATGAVTVAVDSTVVGSLEGAAVTIAGTLSGDINATGLLTIAATGTLTGKATAAANLAVAGAFTGNAAVTGTYTLAGGATATGNVVATGAATINGMHKGDLSSDAAVVAASTANATIEGNILKATTVTLGSAGFAAKVTGNIGALVNNVPSVSGAIVIGVDAALNPLDGKTVVVGNIVSSDNVTLNGTADFQGTATIKGSKEVIVGKFASVKASALTLDYGAKATNSGVADLVVSLIQGGTKTVAAGTDYTNSDFTVKIDSTKFPTYTGSEITDLKTAFGPALAVSDKANALVASAYKLTLVPATVGQKVLEAGSYTLKVETDGGTIKGSLDIEVSVGKAKLSAASVSDIAPVKWTGVQVTPEVEVVIGGAIVDPTNYTVKYSNNTNLGVATATVTFNANASVEAGTLTKEFRIAGDPDKSLASATVALNTNGVYDFTGADLASGVVNTVNLNGDIKAKVDQTFYDASGKKVDKVIQPGKYKVAITAKAGEGFTDSITKEFVVNAKYTVAGWSLKLNGLNDAVYTGATVSASAASARLVFQSGDVHFAYTVKGSALAVNTSKTAAGVADISDVAINDTAAAYLNGSVAAAKVEQKNFTIAPLNLATAELAFGTLDAIKGTVDTASVVFDGNNQAGTLAGKTLYVKTGGAWKPVSVSVTKAVNPDSAGVQGAVTDVGSYSVLVKATASQDNVVGSKTLANAATVTPFDLKAKTLTAVPATYNTLAQLPTDTWNPLTGKDFEVSKDFTMTAVDAQGNAIKATDAGAYKVKVTGMGNYMGTANLVDFTINKLALSDGSVTSNADSVKLPYSQKAQTPLTELYVGVTDPVSHDVVKHVIPTTNYEVKYTDNTAIGAASAAVAPVKDNKNLSATKAVAFSIVATTDLSVAKVTLDTTSFPFDGKDHQGKIVSVVGADGKTLILDQDYTVSGAGTSAAKPAGDYTITINGKGAYAGTQNVKWTIAAADIASATLSGVNDIKWNGVSTLAASAPTKVMLGETALVSGDDFNATFTYEKFDSADGKWKAANAADTAVGLYRVKVAGLNNYVGSTCVKEFRATGIALSTFTFTLNTNATYTGTPIAVTVSDAPVSGPFSELAEGTDYAAVAYNDAACTSPVVNDQGIATTPTNAGTYYVRIEAKEGGNATGASLAVPFKVAPKSITPDTTGKTKVYNGEDQSPLVVKDSSTVLKEGVDYTVEYKNAKLAVVKPRNVETYSATITAVAKGNYTFATGTAVTAVTITPLEITIDDSVYSVAPQVETGEQIVPDVPSTLNVTASVTNAAGETVDKTFALKKTTDYTVSYGANKVVATDGGTVTFTQVANSNYTIDSSPADVTFDIVTINDLAAAKVSAIDTQVFTGKPIMPTLSVTAANGKKLVEGTDYVVSFVSNIEIGTASVLIKGLGSYVGQLATSFTIVSGTERVDGATRYDTMQQVVAQGFDSAETVIIARGDDFPDALAAAGLAGLNSAPVLTTTTAALTDPTIKTLKSLGAKKAIILGDTNSISKAIEAELTSLGVTDISRVGGTSRFDTAEKIYSENKASFGRVAIVTSAYSSADALSIAPYAFKEKAATFLANNDGALTQSTKDLITKANFDKVIVLGGTGRVSAAERAALVAEFGADKVVELGVDSNSRYTTSAEIVKFAAEQGVLDFSKVYVATGSNFADALAAGAPAGNQSAPVLLVDESDASKDAIDEIIGGHASEISDVQILGGTGSVSATVENYINAALKK